MMYPLVRELAVDGVPVTVTCRVLRFSKQAFYQWLRNPVPQRDWDDAHLTNAAWDAHQDDPAFGYRFIADELNHAGLQAGENRLWRLCSEQRLVPRVREETRSEGQGRPARPRRPRPAELHRNRPEPAVVDGHSPAGSLRQEVPPPSIAQMKTKSTSAR